jgi:hypothetical protein
VTVGGRWRGADGTLYLVLNPREVKPGQPRWWVDFVPEPGDRMLGPHDPSRLHLLPAEMFGRVAYALVAT